MPAGGRGRYCGDAEPSEESGEDSEASKTSGESSAQEGSSSDVTPRHVASLVRIVGNPFENHAPWSAYEVLKLLVVGPTLLPLRLLVACLIALSFMGILAIATVGLPLKEEDGCFCFMEPLAPWREALLAPLVPLCRGLLWCFGFWRLRVIDRRHDKTVTPNLIVVAPHLTFVDMLAVVAALPPLPSGVGDSGILRAPCGRRMAVATRGIFVNVRDAESRRSCARLLKTRAGDSWEGPPTMIFPEGRLTNGERLIRFRTGAFAPGEPVLPVLLRYPHRHFNPACVGRNRGALWFLRMMTQFSNSCTVEVLKPYEPDEEEARDAASYARSIRELMANKLRVTTTEHTVEDAFLYRAAAPLCDFEVSSTRKLFDADLEQLKEWLRLFQRVDTDGSGVISRPEFERVLSGCHRLPRSVDRLFDFFDTDDSGSIEYREFVQCLGLISGKCSAVSQAKLAFLVYDMEGCGRVRRSVLRSALANAFPDSCIVPEEHELPRRCHSDSDVPHELSLTARRATVDEVLLPRPVSSAMGSSMVSDEAEELDFSSFCEVAERNPQVLESAMRSLQRRLALAVEGSA